MDATQLQEFLKKHKLWLEGEDGGERADSRSIDLRGANLCEADLRHADLREADLRWADLRGAVLRGADLSDANLSHADLWEADLGSANLYRAGLHGANLTGANIDFSAWPLWCGSLGVKVDIRIIAQLAYHFCSLVCVDDTVKEAFSQARTALLPLANQFHRTDDDVPRLE